jgi:hypothetical protein
MTALKKGLWCLLWPEWILFEQDMASDPYVYYILVLITGMLRDLELLAYARSDYLQNKVCINFGKAATCGHYWNHEKVIL